MFDLNLAKRKLQIILIGMVSDARRNKEQKKKKKNISTGSWKFLKSESFGLPAILKPTGSCGSLVTSVSFIFSYFLHEVDKKKKTKK